MASSKPDPTDPPNPNAGPFLHPAVDMAELTTDLYSSSEDSSSSFPPPAEETLLCVPGALLHLIDPVRSVELASGDFLVARLSEGPHAVAVLARVGGVQWPLTRDAAAVKLDAAHYFFALRAPPDGSGTAPEALNYGLTFSMGLESPIAAQLESTLAAYCNFSVQAVAPAAATALDSAAAGGVSAQAAEVTAAAYWTTLAPNVEEYNGAVARAIAAGSGHVIRGILWCGDVTVDRLRWGTEMLKKRLEPVTGEGAQVGPETLRRIQKVKAVTRMSENVANGVLSGVVKVSGFVTGSIVNSKAGQKFFSMLPGEIVLASFDGFGKICDAVELAGKNVLTTSSTVTTGLVSHRYGEKAAEATNEGLCAAGHAIGTAWAVFKIRKALNPKSVLKPTALAKSAAQVAAEKAKPV